MYDTSKATKVLSGLKTIGYIHEIKKDLWVPLDLKGEVISGPSHKSDAELIVHINHKSPINK